MLRHRISVTTLEKFRRFMADSSSYDTEQALIESMSGAFTGNDKTRFGSAFHKFVEVPTLINQPGDVIATELDNAEKVFMPRHIAEVAVNYRTAHPLMTCELPIGRKYTTSRGDIWVGGRIDAIEGVHIRDTKTKYKSHSVTEYQESCQWKYYLDMLGLKVFWYDIFEIKFFDGLAKVGGVDNAYYPLVTSGRDKQPRPLGIVYHDPIPCYSYLGMHDDCVKLLDQFLEWVEFRKLEHLLKPYEQQWTPAPVIIDLYSDEVLGGKQCPYCGQPSEYVDSSLVYGKSFGMMYRCEPCSAWVGVHTGDPTKSLGRLANSELRQWKIRAHAAFDPLWKQKGMSRTAAYQWLSAQLNQRLEHTHIGMFDVDLCKQAVDVCGGKVPA